MQTAEGCKYLHWLLVYYLHSCFFSMFLILQSKSFQNVKMLRLSWWILVLSSLDHDLAPSCKVTLCYSNAMPLFSVSAYWMFKVQCITFTLAVITNTHCLLLPDCLLFATHDLLLRLFCCHHSPSSEFFSALYNSLAIYSSLFPAATNISQSGILKQILSWGLSGWHSAKLFPETSSSFLWPADNFLEPALCVSPLQLSIMFHCKPGL